MSTGDGAALRAAERLYSRTTREVVTSMHRIRGSRVLVLGCGSSRHMLNIARSGPQSMTFVDVSEDMLARVSRLMGEGGYSDVVMDQYVQMDAWDYVRSGAVPAHDIVIITKCLGQVFKTDPHARSVHGILTGCLQFVPPGGIVVVDHHNAFADSAHGTPITKLVGRGDRDKATIGGRFVDDVAYNSDVQHSEYSQEMVWSSDQRPRGVQAWTQFIYRRNEPSVPLTMGRIDPVHETVPVPFRHSPDGPPSPDAAMLAPRSFTGTKRVPTRECVSALDLTTAVPKFDGAPGVLLIGGKAAVFMSPTQQLSFELDRVFTSHMVLACELVCVSKRDAVVVVVGVISVANVECDPYDTNALESVRYLLRPLHVNGIVVTSPAMLQSVDAHGFVRIGAPGGRNIKLPVDGINFARDGLNGDFIKPASRCTVDLVVNEASRILADAYSFLGLAAPILEWELATPAEESLVGEWQLVDAELGKWKLLWVRVDKVVSNTLGRTMADVMCAHSAYERFGSGDVRDIISFITK